MFLSAAFEMLRHGKKSFSRSGDDLIVKFVFDMIGIKRLSYLDVGAHHLFCLSNSALFHMTGSRGINVEPDPVLFKKFRMLRPRDVNLNNGIFDFIS